MSQVLSQSNPFARKEHGCDLCNRTIRPGERYARAACLGDDGFYEFTECAHCTTMLRAFHEHDFADCYDSWEGYSADDIIEYEPPTLSTLRLKALWRLRWTRRDGSLHEVPAPWGKP